MKILMLGWELPPHNSGGLGVACYYMARALAKQGATIDFVLPYQATHRSCNFMTLHSATKLVPTEFGRMGAYDSWLTGADIRSVQRRYVGYVRKLVRVVKPDVIHAHDWLTMEAGVVAKKIAQVPLIVHVHATEFDRAGAKNGNPLVHEIEYQGLMAADQIIAVSQLTKQLIVEKYHIPASKITVVHNAIDAASFATNYQYDQQTYAYLESLKKEGYLVVAAITRFTVQKGLTFLLQAMAGALSKYHRIVLLLVGDGEQREQLIRLAADLGVADKIYFTGFIRGQRWRDAYTVADVFVMSSLSEPFGLTALEAAYHRDAVVLTKQAGVGEVLRNVFRYDFWDTDRLADQLVGLALSRALRTSLQQAVSQEYDHISWDDVATKELKIYQQARRVVRQKVTA